MEEKATPILAKILESKNGIVELDLRYTEIRKDNAEKLLKLCQSHNPVVKLKHESIAIVEITPESCHSELKSVKDKVEVVGAEQKIGFAQVLTLMERQGAQVNQGIRALSEQQNQHQQVLLQEHKALAAEQKKVSEIGTEILIE